MTIATHSRAVLAVVLPVLFFSSAGAASAQLHEGCFVSAFNRTARVQADGTTEVPDIDFAAPDGLVAAVASGTALISATNRATRVQADGTWVPQICLKSSLLITMQCRNETQVPWEWLEPNDRRAAWELKRPDQQVDRTSASRYTTASELVSLAPGHELSLTIPVTRWFGLHAPGSYRLRSASKMLLAPYKSSPTRSASR